MESTYVVRKHWGIEGGQQHYDHAYIHTDSEWSAIHIAMGERIAWTRVDDFDNADQTFANFSVVATYESATELP